MDSKDDLILIVEEITNESASNYNKLTDTCARSPSRNDVKKKSMLKENT